MDFGKIIKRILLDKDMTQTQIADSLGMSKQSLNSFLSRKDHRINSDIIPAIRSASTWKSHSVIGNPERRLPQTSRLPRSAPPSDQQTSTSA